jgi:hypothetical protein
MPPPTRRRNDRQPHSGLSTQPKQPRRWSRRASTRQQTNRNSDDPNPLLRAEQLPPARRGPPGPTAAPRSASGRSWTPTPRWRSPIDRRRKRNAHTNDPAALDRPHSFRNDTEGSQIPWWRGENSSSALPSADFDHGPQLCRRVAVRRTRPANYVHQPAGLAEGEHGSYCRVVNTARTALAWRANARRQLANRRCSNPITCADGFQLAAP